MTEETTTERAIVVKKKGFPGVFLKSFMKNGARISEKDFFEIAKRTENSYRESFESLDPVLILSTIFFTCSCNSHDNFEFKPFNDMIDSKYGDNKIKQFESYIYQLYLCNSITPFFVSGKALFKDEIMKLITVITKVLKNEVDEIDFSSILIPKCYFSDAFFISILTKDELVKNGWNFYEVFPYNDPFTAVVFSIMI